ncbi:GntR family transcriptional regulator [Yinghuangia soli]|uniref:GntR family transcriptional regulator n=1 Tax=Yinghuangia soli TaxID=2908204 RepID=A0AA41U4U8_9ACTN|nr:GntR family transcriptional regulator [Yinghuangia soli]MCF2533325.1 GntR family transcriptional regulator [Yinghuangia soli]
MRLYTFYFCPAPDAAVAGEATIASRFHASGPGTAALVTGPEGLSRPTSSQQVAEYIRRLIFDKTLRTGDRIPQDEIAADLRVSRVPVREAVIALDREGWVTLEPHRGAFANGLDENSTRDHYGMLGQLYGYAAARAAERGSDESFAELQSLHRMLQAATDPGEFFHRNTAYLRQLVAMAQSRRIETMTRVFTTNLVPGNFFEEVPGVMRIQKRSLKAVTKAVTTRNADAAQTELATMLRTQADNVVTLLRSRDLLA